MTRSATDSVIATWQGLPPMIQWLLLTAGLAGIYFASGLLGQVMAVPPGNITVVWPPSGIALAAILLFGRKALMGIFIGALLANTNFVQDVTTAGDLIAALLALVSIGVGSTLQPLLGHTLVSSFIKDGDPFANSRSAVRFLFIAPVMCLVSCTFGASALWLTDLNQGAPYIGMWVSWWFGDTLGVLVFTPLIVSVKRQSSFQWFVLVAILVGGGGTTYFASETLRSDAITSWETGIEQEADRLTTVFLEWNEEAAAPLETLGTFFNNSTEVTETEFWRAIYQIEDYNPNSIPVFLGYAIPNVAQNADNWTILYTTDPDGKLSKRPYGLPPGPLLDTIEEANRNLNVEVLGPSYQDGRGLPVAALALSARNNSQDGVLVAVIDYTELLSALFELEVPAGFSLNLLARSADLAAYSKQQNIWDAEDVDEARQKRVTLRSTVYRTEYTFEWVVDTGIYGGPDSEFADVVFYGGIATTVLLTILFAFAIAQNERISRQVARRTNELQLSEDRFRSLVDNIPGVTYRCALDEHWTMFFMSDAVEELTGYPASDFVDNKVRAFSSVIHPEDEARVEKVITSAVGKKESFNLEYRVVHKDGKVKSVFERGRFVEPEADDDGWLDGAIFDITDRVELEAELRDSEARSKSILDNATVASAIGSFATGQIVYANQQMADMFHTTIDELIGRKTADFYNTPEDRDRIISQLQDSGRAIDVDVKFRRDDGTQFDTLMSMNPITYDGEPCVLASIFDISERKAMEEASKLQQKAIASSSNAISIVDYSGTKPVITSVNQALLTLMGLEESDLVGHDPARLIGDKTDPEVLSQAVDDIQNQQTSTCILHLGTRNGEDIWTSTSFSPVHNDDGQLTHYVNVSVDISERLKMEHDLRDAKETAEAAAQAKSDFLAAMSHEIRTPMNGVVGMVDLLTQTELDGEQRQMITTMRDSGHSLLTIINDILDFSKIEAGKLEIEEIDMAMTDVVEGAAQTMAPNALKKHLSLITYVDPDLPTFKIGDPTRVRQILINLGGNAIKFSDEGSVVQIRAEKARSVGPEAERIRFSIVDQGIGISEEAQGKLFQEFSQADMSTTRKFGGTGLGLAICKRLTELMGGEIGVDSVLGQGSTFWCELPLGASDKKQEDRKVKDLSDLRILVVSPVAAYREVCRGYLSHWNADVEVTTDIRECLKRAQDDQARGEPIDIIVVPDVSDQRLIVETRHAFIDAGLMPYPRFVIGEDPREKSDVLKDLEEVTMMDVNPMRRAGLLTAVAIAAGRASPEVGQDVEIETIEKVRAPTVEEALAQGKLILLAEDNLTNQLVIRKQLNTLGYQCEIANDGKEGFEMWQSKDYCMLLTDCHMPEWDGFELTDAVRKSEESTNKRSPIVAITANALQGEAERCIAAGMDDYMSKPVEMKLLKQTLLKWMGDGGVAGSVSAEPADETLGPSQEPTKPKVEVVSQDEGSCPVDDRMLKDMFGDDDAMFKEILLSFVDPTEAIIADLKAAFEDRSAADVKAQAHKLKSSSRSVGANELADTCLALETAGKEEDWDTIETLAPKVEPLFNEVKGYVDSL